MFSSGVLWCLMKSTICNVRNKVIIICKFEFWWSNWCFIKKCNLCLHRFRKMVSMSLSQGYALMPWFYEMIIHK